MKVLILSCNTGEGHNSAARAIDRHIRSLGMECTVTDTLSLVGPSLSKSVSDMYIYSTQTNLFKYIYKIGTFVSDLSDRVKSPVYLWNSSHADKVLEHITENRFDAVICVHLFPAQTISYLRLKGRLSIPAIFVMTDYTCIPFLDETIMDCYVIPHEHLIEEFAEKGIPRAKIFPFGIPVDSAFHRTGPKVMARNRLIRMFGWNDTPTYNNWFLIMTGSMGFGSTQEIIDETIRQSMDGTEIIAICGRNEEMLDRLKEENRYIHTVHPIGFTDKISLLMDACDVLFTKPGGISSTEGMSKQIPMIHTAPIPGCESRNAEFFHYHGMSYSCNDTRQQVVTALRLCEDKEYRRKMTGAQRLNAKPDTCHRILGLLKDRVS